MSSKGVLRTLKHSLTFASSMHGGGWIVGRPETDDISNRNLCRQRNVLIFSIDYRLAPEHPYPIPMQDCEDVLCWVI
jgi:acetyl esterase/lipase